VSAPRGDHVLRREEAGRDREVRVVLRVSDRGLGMIVVESVYAGRVVGYVTMLGSTALGVQSGIDEAFECLDGQGRVVRLPKRLAG
jgi:hypothetical protein